MGLDAYVACRCYAEGRTPPPPGNMKLKVAQIVPHVIYHLMETTFHVTHSEHIFKRFIQRFVNNDIVADTDFLYDQFWVEQRQVFGQQMMIPTAHKTTVMGRDAITPRSSIMPTDRKKKPSRIERNGSTSLSSSWR